MRARQVAHPVDHVVVLHAVVGAVRSDRGNDGRDIVGPEQQQRLNLGRTFRPGLEQRAGGGIENQEAPVCLRGFTGASDRAEILFEELVDGAPPLPGFAGLAEQRPDRVENVRRHGCQRRFAGPSARQLRDLHGAFDRNVRTEQCEDRVLASLRCR